MAKDTVLLAVMHWWSLRQVTTLSEHRVSGSLDPDWLIAYDQVRQGHRAEQGPT